MALLKIRKTPTAQAITPILGVAGLSIDENNVPYIVTDTGDIIPIGESTLSQEILDALASAESPTGDNPFVTLAQLQSFIGTSTILLYGGSAQWSGTGLVFDGSPSGYLIENVLYEIGADTITAAAADSTNDRRDTFKLTVSGWDIETGTPSAVPIAPTVNPITEIGLKDVLIEANATTPTIDTENVYLENSEWATSSSGAGTFNPASTGNPFAGAVAFESTNIQNGSRYIFTRASNIDLTNFDSIGLRINLKAPMNNGRNFGVQFLNDSGNAISTLFPLPISKSLDLAYQFVSLDLVDFLFSDRTAVRGLQIVYYGSGGAPTYAGAFVDNIILQSGFGVQPVFDGVESVTGNIVDNTDPKNPVVTSKVPTGGLTGQVLTKQSDDDFDADWEDSQGGGGIPEAPNDGEFYARKDESWEAFAPFSVDGTPTEADVVTFVSGVPTWQAPSGGGGETVQIVSTSGDFNELTPSASTIIFTASSGTVTLNGIVAGSDGQEIKIVNSSANNLIINHESGSASADNRFRGTVNLARFGATAIIKYRASQNRWVLISGWFLSDSVNGFYTNNAVGFGVSPTSSRTVHIRAFGNTNAFNALFVTDLSGNQIINATGGRQIFLQVQTILGQFTPNSNVRLSIRGIGTGGTATIEIFDSAGVPNCRFRDDGNIDFLRLPTSDPLISGRLWNDSGTVKISAG